MFFFLQKRNFTCKATTSFSPSFPLLPFPLPLSSSFPLPLISWSVCCEELGPGEEGGEGAPSDILCLQKWDLKHLSGIRDIIHIRDIWQVSIGKGSECDGPKSHISWRRMEGANLLKSSLTGIERKAVQLLNQLGWLEQNPRAKIMKRNEDKKQHVQVLNLNPWFSSLPSQSYWSSSTVSAVSVSSTFHQANLNKRSFWRSLSCTQ